MHTCFVLQSVLPIEHDGVRADLQRSSDGFNRDAGRPLVAAILLLLLVITRVAGLLLADAEACEVDCLALDPHRLRRPGHASACD